MISELFRTLWLSVITNRDFIRTCVLGIGLIISAGTIWFAYANRKKWTLIIAAVAVVVYIMLLVIM